jgi:hypothetical protein
MYPCSDLIWFCMSKTLNFNQLNAVRGEGCLVRYGKWALCVVFVPALTICCCASCWHVIRTLMPVVFRICASASVSCVCAVRYVICFSSSVYWLFSFSRRCSSYRCTYRRNSYRSTQRGYSCSLCQMQYDAVFFVVNILLLSSVLYLQYGARRDLTGVRIFRVTYALSTTCGNISAEVTMCSHCSEMYIRYNRHFG